MPISRHQFSHADTDTSPSDKPANAFDSALNISLEPGYITAVAGNVAVPYALPPTGVNVRLGGFENGSTGTAVSLLYNSLGAHRLIRYDPLGNGGAGVETTLFEWAGLNLAADTVVQGGILDGILMYLDASGVCRSINLQRAAGGAYTPALLLADPYALHLVKRPPTSTPLATRVTVAGTAPETATRIVQDKAFQFTTRWRYVDGEPTVFGPYSPWLDVREDPALTALNAIHVTIAVPPPLVAEVDVLVRQAGLQYFQVARTLRRVDGVFPLSLDFFGSVEGETPASSEQVKLFESLWPAKTLGIGRSRVIVADMKEGLLIPLPALSAVAQMGDVGQPGAIIPIYLVSITYSGRGRNDDALPYYAYTLASNPTTLPYPNTGSTYNRLDVLLDSTGIITGYRPSANTALIPYTDAFVTPHWVEEVSRTITVLQGTPILMPAGNGTTFLSRSTVPVSIQFYDALGRFGGAAPAIPVFIPSPGTQLTYQRIRWALGSSDPDVLNAEIPAWAESYHILTGRNSRATVFLQGETSNVEAYFGTKTVTTSGVSTTSPDLQAMTTPHQRLWVNISNWANNGRGYVWTSDSGDVLRFINEEVDCQITDQQGDYLEVSWTGHPISTETLIEVYTPTTTTDTTLYETGPRYAITRREDGNGVERRGYSVTGALLDGDCFIEDIPTASHSRTVPATVAIPAFRARRVGITARSFARGDNGPSSGREGLSGDVRGQTTTTTVSPSANRTDLAASAWLDASRRGRPTQAIPLALQQVRRPALIRYSGVKVSGTLLNGLGVFDALNQFDELPQEQGAITRLTVADQTQTDGSILLVNQERGDVSLSLGQARLQTADGSDLLTQTKSVIGGANALRGGYGCTDPASVVEYAGKVFFWCARRAELLRYDRNGLTPLGITYKARVRLEQLARDYAGVRVRTCYDPRRKEAWLSFPATATLPATTVVYSERREAWADALSYAPEAGLAVGNELVSWDAAVLYRHTPDAPAATFAGTYTAPQLTFSVAAPGGVAKHFLDVAVEAPVLWGVSDLQTDTGLQSLMKRDWFVYREGVYRAGLRRSLTSPGFPTIFHALANGLPLIGSRLSVTMTAPRGAGPLTACSVSYQPRFGQQMSV